MDSYRCASCNKAFGRLEHLKRHEQSHKDPGFRCDKCSKSFHRKDALNRHELTHLADGPSLLRRGARACSACRLVKSRCSGNRPCARCYAKGSQCIYPISRGQSSAISAADLRDGGGHGSHGPNPSSLPLAQTGMRDESSDFLAYQPQPGLVASPSADTRGDPYPADAGAVLQPSSSTQYSTSQNPLEESATTSAFVWPSNLTINWLQPDDINFDGGEFNDVFPIFPADYSFSPSISLVSPAQENSVEFPSNPSGAVAPPSTTPAANDGFGGLYTSPTTDSSTPADNPTVASGEYYVDGDAGRLPKSKRRRIVPRPSSLNVVDAADFLLQYPLPIVPCTNPNLLLSPEIYGHLCLLYQRLCLEPTVFKAYRPSEFPPKQALEGLLTNFFSHFGQTLPFLHEPTFTSALRHCVLLLPMMALGSCFLTGESSEVFSRSLHEFVRRLLILVEEDDSWRPPSQESLAQAQILHAVGAKYALNDPLRAFTSRSLCSATQYCRDGWLRQEPAHHLDPHDNSVSSQWKSWVRKEESIRTGLCIWLIDCMWAFQFRHPPHLRLDDASGMRLPCPDRQWTADMAEWNQLRAGLDPPTPTLREALQNLYIDKRLLPGMGEFSHILLIHGLFHRTWEVEVMVTQSLSHFEPSAQKQASDDLQPKLPIWPPGVPFFSRWRNAACDCLDLLHWSANATIGAASGIEHPTVLHLHLARIVLLTPLNDIVLYSHYLIRSSGEATRLFPSVSSTEAEEHRQLIQRWAIQDQYKARLAAIHAGVVFWHVRLYSINGFYESTAVALAALVFWALSAFSPKKPKLRKQFVRQGHAMRANMTGVGDLFGPKGARKVLAEGQKLLLTLSSWRGITDYWLRVLNRLEKVTAAAGLGSQPAEVAIAAVE
ncbi:Fungal specific transcription factor domain-containing protein [Cladophialophora immunda]|nr:Fungal specific transcription factor domain-containing protein [Cladophialophora immunda]